MNARFYRMFIGQIYKMNKFEIYLLEIHFSVKIAVDNKICGAFFRLDI